MPFVIVNRERYALPIGETRVGGSGDDALPFPELAKLGTLAVLSVMPDGTTTVRRGGDAAVAIDGRSLGAEALPLRHGARIEAGGVRLVFGDLREAGATIRVTGVAGNAPALPFLSGEAEPTADFGGRLTVLESGAVVTIPDGGLTIGRDPESGLAVRGKEVSRRHAAIRTSIQGYVLRDLSTNGTYVNDRRVDGSQVLGMGDIIRIGEEQFRFEADPASYEPTPDLRDGDAAVTHETPAQTPSLEPRTEPRLEAVRLLATLEVIRGGAPKGTRFPIERPVVHIGGGPRSDVRLSHSSVSDPHATVTRRNGAWVVVDRGSAGGTYVNGQRVAGEHALPAECALRLGDVVLKFRDATESPAPASPTRDARGVFGRLAKLWKG